MDELRKNHILQLRTRGNDNINGVVVDFEKDRILVLISDESVESAKKLEELDELLVHAHTHCGIKKMLSSVISKLNWKNQIIIENTTALPVVQKREFVRVLSNHNFTIENDDNVYNCICMNISAGGIAFRANEANFKPDDEVIVKFFKKDFGKDITVGAKIIKSYNNEYTAQYINLDKYDADKIVKYVFNLIAKK